MMPTTKEGFHMPKEKREQLPRLEPSSVNVLINTGAGVQFTGYILDVSRGGLAIDLPEKAELLEVGSKIEVSVSSEDSLGRWISLGAATVLRTWTQSAYFDNGKGIALKLDDQLTEPAKYRLLMKGTQQNTRLKAQVRVAEQDIDYLSQYRRALFECQMKLYANTITFSVSLAAAYFALTYYGIATNRFSDPDMSFWRTLLAALPGTISVAFALMVSQKNASIQRVDAYLAVLKECLIRNQYPREYRGWETESLKFRQIMKTAKCKDCAIVRKCGTLTESEQQEATSRKLLRNPSIDLYYIMMYLTFYFILIASMIAVIIEVRKFQWNISVYMVISSAITLVMFIAGVSVFYLTYHLRKGKFSLEYYTRCWKDLFSRCRKSVYQ
jgi:hypothetical protein